ncbi:MAG: diacylglycerol/lipid kinase family protein [Coriobacteriia bacterium]
MTSLGTCLAIVNPQAKHGMTGTMLPAVRQLMDGVIDYEMVLSQGPQDAARIAREATGVDTVIAVGGDGTVHEVLNGLMARPADDRPAMALLPTGSGNDYRRTLGISTDLSTAVRQIAGGERRKMDVGTVNGTYFANSLSIGMDARVTAKAVELKVSTGWSGLPLYLRALMYVLFKQLYPHHVTVSIDGGEPSDLDMLLVAFTNGPTYGGGFFITPDAAGDDGLLDMCLIDPLPLGEALWRLPFVIAGKHTRMRPVHMSRHSRVLLISETPLEGQVDGETMLERSYDIGILPAAIDVIVPTERR